MSRVLVALIVVVLMLATLASATPLLRRIRSSGPPGGTTAALAVPNVTKFAQGIPFPASLQTHWPNIGAPSAVHNEMLYTTLVSTDRSSACIVAANMTTKAVQFTIQNISYDFNGLVVTSAYYLVVGAYSSVSTYDATGNFVYTKAVSPKGEGIQWQHTGQYLYFESSGSCGGACGGCTQRLFVATGDAAPNATWMEPAAASGGGGCPPQIKYSLTMNDGSAFVLPAQPPAYPATFAAKVVNVATDEVLLDVPSGQLADGAQYLGADETFFYFSNPLDSYNYAYAVALYHRNNGAFFKQVGNLCEIVTQTPKTPSGQYLAPKLSANGNRFSVLQSCESNPSPDLVTIDLTTTGASFASLQGGTLLAGGPGNNFLSCWPGGWTGEGYYNNLTVFAYPNTQGAIPSCSGEACPRQPALMSVELQNRNFPETFALAQTGLAVLVGIDSWWANAPAMEVRSLFTGELILKKKFDTSEEEPQVAVFEDLSIFAFADNKAFEITLYGF